VQPEPRDLEVVRRARRVSLAHALENGGEVAHVEVVVELHGAREETRRHLFVHGYRCADDLLAAHLHLVRERAEVVIEYRRVDRGEV